MESNKDQNSNDMLSKYEFIVNTSREFMTIINRDYQYEAVNKAYAEAAEKAVEDIIGKTVKDIWSEKQFEKIIEPNLITAFQGKEIHYQSWFSFPKGTKRYFDVAYYPYRNEEDEITHLVIVTRDITKQKELENQVRKAEKLTAVGDLTSGIAHEIRNPLAIMKSTAQYVQKHYQEMTKEKIRQNMDVLVETTDRINKTILDLIEFTKPHCSYLTERNLLEIIRKSLEIVSDKCKANKIQTELNSEKEEIYLRLDEQHLENALVQILLNAIESQPNGGCIKIYVEETEEAVNITISDMGEGIDEKNLQQVFNPFFTTKSTGSGLGLSLAYQIIKEHDGIIDISSKVHKGTQVTMKFFKFGVKNG